MQKGNLIEGGFYQKDGEGVDKALMSDKKVEGWGGRLMMAGAHQGIALQFHTKSRLSLKHIIK